MYSNTTHNNSNSTMELLVTNTTMKTNNDFLSKKVDDSNINQFMTPLLLSLIGFFIFAIIAAKVITKKYGKYANDKSINMFKRIAINACNVLSNKFTEYDSDQKQLISYKKEKNLDFLVDFLI